MFRPLLTAPRFPSAPPPPPSPRAGLRSQDLICVHYEAHLEDDLGALREKLRIIPAPEGTAFVKPAIERGPPSY